MLWTLFAALLTLGLVGAIAGIPWALLLLVAAAAVFACAVHNVGPDL
jgi:uncharacterized protein YqgC (DUF456 family)